MEITHRNFATQASLQPKEIKKYKQNYVPFIQKNKNKFKPPFNVAPGEVSII